MLVAHGFGVFIGADFSIEPAAGVEPLGFPGQGQPPLSESLFQESLVEPGQVAHRADPQRVQTLFGDLAHARDLAYRQGREERGFIAGEHPKHAVGLGLVGTNFGYQARSCDADGAVELDFAVNGLVQSVSRAQWRPMQALRAAHVQVGFINRDHLDLRREVLQNFVHFLRIFAIAVGVAVHEDGMGTKLGGGAQGHGGVHAKLARFIRSGGNHAALIALPANYHGFAAQPRIKQFLRSEEHTSELQSRRDLVCRLLLEKKKITSTSSSTAGLKNHSVILFYLLFAHLPSQSLSLICIDNQFSYSMSFHSLYSSSL